MTAGVLILTMLLTQNPAKQALTGVVTGQLLRVDGTPASGVRIAVTPVPDPKDPAPAGDLMSLASSDEAGNYRLEDILPGRYYIQAGLLDYPNYYPGTSSLDKATVVTVTAGELVHVDAFKLVKPPGVRISGHLPSDPNGRQQSIIIGATDGPVQPQMIVNGNTSIITVRIAGGGSFTTNVVGGASSFRILGVAGAAGFGTPNQTTIHDDGTFEILGVRPGSYTLFVVPTGIQTLVTAEDRDIEIHSTAEGGVRVSGVLGLTDRSREVNEKLRLSGPVWERIDTVTDAAGHFEFSSIPPGTYTIRSSDGIALSTVVVGNQDVKDVAIARVTILFGQIVIEDKSAPNAVPPMLVATKSDGTQIPMPIPRGAMTVFGDGGTATTFKLPLSEGEYRLALSNVLPPFFVKSMTYGEVDLLKNALVVDGNTSKQILVTIGRNQ